MELVEVPNSGRAISSRVAQFGEAQYKLTKRKPGSVPVPGVTSRIAGEVLLSVLLRASLRTDGSQQAQTARWLVSC